MDLSHRVRRDRHGLAVLAGILLFAEPASANGLMLIVVIVIGIVGLNLSSA